MSDTSINFPGVMAYGGNYDYTYLNTAATTTIKPTKALLHTIAVTKAGAASSTITVYDNTTGSGTVIAVIDGTVVATHTFDVETSTGLTVVVAGTTAPTCTVSSL